MLSWPARRHVGPRRDDVDKGFTLIEVVVAVALMAMVMVSVAALYMRGTASSSSLQRNQAAVALGDRGLELVRSVAAQPNKDGNIALVLGRSKSAVDAQWAAAATDLSSMNEAYDAAATGSSTPTIPLSRTDTVSGETYATNTYIGTCYRASASQDCVASPHTGVMLYRAIVAVTWKAGPGVTCANNTCVYTTSTLLDPDRDPLFNTTTSGGTQMAPLAIDDTSTVTSGQPGTIAVLTNDLGTFGTAPVTVVTPPSHGSLSGNIGGGQPVYTSAAGFTGTDTFTYILTDTVGQQSAAATVTITVKPPLLAAANDSASVKYGGSVIIPVLSNDIVTGTPSVVVTKAPTGATAVVQSDRSILFTANAATCTGKHPTQNTQISFTYTLTDSFGQTASATVAVTAGCS